MIITSSGSSFYQYWHLAFVSSVHQLLNVRCDSAVSSRVSQHSLSTGLPGEHMSLPAEVLPQLLGCSALSGTPKAQRGLWNLCQGTWGKSLRVARLQSCYKYAVYLCAVPSVWEDTQRRLNGKQMGSVWPRLPQGGMRPSLQCVTFTVGMLVYLSGPSLCFVFWF